MMKLAQLSDLRDVMTMTSNCIRAMRGDGINQWDDIYPNASVFEHDINERHLYVLRSDTLIGCVTINEIQSPEYASVRWMHSEAPILVIHRLMVDPSQQGKGYAKKIMEYTESIASEKLASTIRLDAYTLNPISLRLYESLNYRKAGEVKFRKGSFICYEKKL